MSFSGRWSELTVTHSPSASPMTMPSAAHCSTSDDATVGYVDATASQSDCADKNNASVEPPLLTSTHLPPSPHNPMHSRAPQCSTQAHLSVMLSISSSSTGKARACISSSTPDKGKMLLWPAYPPVAAAAAAAHGVGVPRLSCCRANTLSTSDEAVRTLPHPHARDGGRWSHARPISAARAAALLADIISPAVGRDLSNWSREVTPAHTHTQTSSLHYFFLGQDRTVMVNRTE